MSILTRAVQPLLLIMEVLSLTLICLPAGRAIGASIQPPVSIDRYCSGWENGSSTTVGKTTVRIGQAAQLEICVSNNSFSPLGVTVQLTGDNVTFYPGPSQSLTATSARSDFLGASATDTPVYFSVVLTGTPTGVSEVRVYASLFLNGSGVDSYAFTLQVTAAGGPSSPNTSSAIAACLGSLLTNCTLGVSLGGFFGLLALAVSAVVTVRYGRDDFFWGAALIFGGLFGGIISGGAYMADPSAGIMFLILFILGFPLGFAHSQVKQTVLARKDIARDDGSVDRDIIGVAEKYKRPLSASVVTKELGLSLPRARKALHRFVRNKQGRVYTDIDGTEYVGIPSVWKDLPGMETKVLNELLANGGTMQRARLRSWSNLPENAFSQVMISLERTGYVVKDEESDSYHLSGAS